MVNSPVAMIQQRSKGGRPGAGAGGFASGKMTVRLKAGQQAIEQEMVPIRPLLQMITIFI